MREVKKKIRKISKEITDMAVTLFLHSKNRENRRERGVSWHKEY